MLLRKQASVCTRSCVVVSDMPRNGSVAEFQLHHLTHQACYRPASSRDRQENYGQTRHIISRISCRIRTSRHLLSRSDGSPAAAVSARSAEGRTHAEVRTMTAVFRVVEAHRLQGHLHCDLLVQYPWLTFGTASGL